MISHGIPIYVALEPVDMRLGAERLGGIVREKRSSRTRSSTPGASALRAACGEMSARRLGVEVDQADLAAAPHFIPTVVLSNGKELSGGFRRRVSLMR